jgi:glycosyltransferase involved in cell wall biosynthesis
VLTFSSDISRLDLDRPAGPAVYALAVLEALRSTGEVEVVGPRRAREASVILSLDGRFRAGRGQRIVTVVSDLGHLLERRGYGPREWLAQDWRVALAARRSDHILAPSTAVEVGLARYLGTPRDRVTVFEPHPGAAFRRRPRAEVAELRTALGLPPRYLLFVGNRSRRKNLGLLARAWTLAGGRLGTEVGLVLAGAGPGLVPGAHDVGYVDARRLPALISGAVAWVNPSLYEGSAIGVLEAISCGAPPLVATTGASPRAAGRAGILLDPHDPQAWAEAMVAVVTNPGLRASLAAAGLKAAAELRATPPDPGGLLESLLGSTAVRPG